MEADALVRSIELEYEGQRYRSDTVPHRIAGMVHRTASRVELPS